MPQRSEFCASLSGVFEIQIGSDPVLERSTSRSPSSRWAGVLLNWGRSQSRRTRGCVTTESATARVFVVVIPRRAAGTHRLLERDQLVGCRASMVLLMTLMGSPVLVGDW